MDRCLSAVEQSDRMRLPSLEAPLLVAAACEQAVQKGERWPGGKGEEREGREGREGRGGREGGRERAEWNRTCVVMCRAKSLYLRRAATRRRAMFPLSPH
jgi:hypothetical protein